jgi:copper oxidase (laccase) domain-containing protein
MQERCATRPSDLQAVIGPGIGVDAFEVGNEVYQAFCDAGFPMAQTAIRKTKWHIDLWKANEWLLRRAGVGNITTAGICTYHQQDEFFSARRLGIRSGRILNGIFIKKK